MMTSRTVRILLAEDNPADIFLLQHAFGDVPGLDIDLTVLTDGEAAINHVRNAPESCDFDLVILDLNLPRKDGSDVLQAIRARDEFAGIPVVVLTSSDSPSDRALARHFGADGYFIKPSDLDEFYRLSRALLALATGGEPRRAASVH